MSDVFAYTTVADSTVGDLGWAAATAATIKDSIDGLSDVLGDDPGQYSGAAALAEGLKTGIGSTRDVVDLTAQLMVMADNRATPRAMQPLLDQRAGVLSQLTASAPPPDRHPSTLNFVGPVSASQTIDIQCPCAAELSLPVWERVPALDQELSGYQWNPYVPQDGQFRIRVTSLQKVNALTANAWQVFGPAPNVAAEDIPDSLRPWPAEYENEEGPMGGSVFSDYSFTFLPFPGETPSNIMRTVSINWTPGIDVDIPESPNSSRGTGLVSSLTFLWDTLNQIAAPRGTVEVDVIDYEMVEGVIEAGVYPGSWVGPDGKLTARLLNEEPVVVNPAPNEDGTFTGMLPNGQVVTVPADVEQYENQCELP